MAYDNTDTGVLFRQREKQSDKHPDYTGKINVGGTDYRLAAWVNESERAGKYLKIKVSEFRERDDLDQRPAEDGGDIPF